MFRNALRWAKLDCSVLRRKSVAHPSKFVQSSTTAGNMPMTSFNDCNLPEDMVTATVTHLGNLSKSVKSLNLHISARSISFRAGQWVDFYIPNETAVAGFSICSSPRLLREAGVIQLAVKLTEFPPVQWIHSKCNVGSTVGIRVGGEFFYDPQQCDPQRDLLLIAGGVGINPLLSIMRHVSDLSGDQQNDHHGGRIVLLYSARCAEELIFQEEIRELVRLNKNMSVEFFITRQPKKDAEDHPDTQHHRIDEHILSSVLHSSFDNSSNVECFICGPCDMIDRVDSALLHLGVTQSRIRYEKWW